MFAKLKISSRILIVSIGLFILSSSSGLIYMHSNAQFAPNALEYDNVYRYEWSEQKFYFDEIKNIQITRGFWNVVVIPSDSNFIKIQGGMSILNYHLIANQTDTDILLSLSDSIKDDFLYKFDAEVYTNSLESINLESFANMRIDSTKYDTLNVTLKNGAMLQLKDCIINELNFTSYNLSTLETESCFIGNASLSMYDTSYAIIYSAENIVNNIQEGFTTLMTYDANDNFNYRVSDSLLQILSTYPEFIKNLKWGTVIQKPFIYKGADLGELDSITYNYSYLDQPELSHKRTRARDYLYRNRQSISFENELFVKGIKNTVRLEYSNGLLYSIMFSFNNIDTEDSLYNIIMKRLNERIELPEDVFPDSSYYEDRDKVYIFLSYVPHAAAENKYDINIMKDRINGYTSIDLIVSHSLWEEYSYRDDKYSYYVLPFVSCNFANLPFVSRDWYY